MAFREIYTTDLYAEAEPYYKFELEGVELPPVVMRNVTNLVLKEECGKRGQVSFKYTDTDHGDLELFHLNQKLVVWAGYRHQFERRGPFGINSVVETFPGRRVVYEIKAEEATKFSAKGARRVFRNGTLLDLFKRVAGEHDLEVVTEGLENVDLPVDDETPIVQAGENDAVFLQRVAKEYGWIMTALDGKIHLTGPVARKALGIIELHLGDPSSNMASVKVTRKKPKVLYDKPGLAAVLSELQPIPTALRNIMYAATVGHSPRAAEVLNGLGITAQVVSLQVPAVADSVVKWAEGVVAKEPGEDEFAAADAIKGSRLGRRKIFGTTLGEAAEAYASDKAGVSRSHSMVNRIFFDTDINTELTGALADAVMRRVPKEASGEAMSGEPSTDRAAMVGPADLREAVKKLSKKRLMLGNVEKIDIDLRLGSMRFRPQMNTIVVGLTPRVNGDYRVHATVNDFTSGYKTGLEMRAGWYKKKSLSDIEVTREGLLAVIAGATAFNPILSVASTELARSGFTVADAVGQGALSGLSDAILPWFDDPAKRASSGKAKTIIVEGGKMEVIPGE